MGSILLRMARVHHWSKNRPAQPGLQYSKESCHNNKEQRKLPDKESKESCQADFLKWMGGLRRLRWVGSFAGGCFLVLAGSRCLAQGNLMRVARENDWTRADREPLTAQAFR
jgi:hypothetical protein